MLLMLHQCALSQQKKKIPERNGMYGTEHNKNGIRFKGLVCGYGTLAHNNEIDNGAKSFMGKKMDKLK